MFIFYFWIIVFCECFRLETMYPLPTTQSSSYHFQRSILTTPRTPSPKCCVNWVSAILLILFLYLGEEHHHRHGVLIKNVEESVSFQSAARKEGGRAYKVYVKLIKCMASAETHYEAKRLWGRMAEGYWHGGGRRGYVHPFHGVSPSGNIIIDDPQPTNPRKLMSHEIFSSGVLL